MNEVTHLAFACFEQKDGTTHVLKKITVDCRGFVKDYEAFIHLVERLKKKILQDYPAATGVTIVRPLVMTMAQNMEKWLQDTTDTSTKHIGTCCIVRSKSDDSLAWPVFTTGYDIQNEAYRPLMLKSCKEVSLSRMGNKNQDMYISDEEVYVFDNVSDPVWHENLLRLFLTEERYAQAQKEYRYFVFTSATKGPAKS